jgi:hypothetical protein
VPIKLLLNMNKWVSPNTIAGDEATGAKYFKRPDINEDF